MKQLQKQLNKIDGYLMKIERNVMEGRYELTVGIPPKWVYKSTKNVECEELGKSEEGTLLKIYANKDSIVIDDLIEFVNIIIDTNQQIAKMQEEHQKAMEEATQKMVEQELAFGEEIDNLAETSFEKMKKEQDKLGSESNILKKENLEELEKKDDELKKEVEETLSR